MKEILSLKWYEAIFCLVYVIAVSAVAAHFMGGWARLGATFVCTAIPMAACVIIMRYGFYVSTKNKVIVMEDGDVQAILDHINAEATSEDAKMPFVWKPLDRPQLLNMIRGVANQGAIAKQGEIWELIPSVFLQVIPQCSELVVRICSVNEYTRVDRCWEGD